MTAVDVVTGEVVTLLTKPEAEELTHRIGSFLETTWQLLLKAHDGCAHLAMGYGTWGEYVEAEFDMSRSRSYQLLDLGRVVAAIDSVSTMVDIDSISEREAREGVPLLNDPPLLADSFVAATDKAKSEGRKRTHTDVAEAVEERQQPTGPVDTDTDSPWARKQRAKAAEDARIAAEKKALDQARAAFRKQLDKARPLLELSAHETAGLLDGTETGPLRSTLLDLAGWCRDLADLLDNTEPLGGTT